MRRLIERVRDSYNKGVRRPYGHVPSKCQLDFLSRSDEIIHEWKQFKHRNPQGPRPIDQLSAAQTALNQDGRWKAFFILVYGHVNPEAEHHFPITTLLARKWRSEAVTVFFSIMEPGKRIPPHTGSNHGVIRAQIGVDVPDEGGSGLRVADHTVSLRKGELFIFDDTFEHEAWNEGESDRTVLIIDTRKRFPHILGLCNRYMLNEMKDSEYVQSTIAKLNAH